MTNPLYLRQQTPDELELHANLYRIAYDESVRALKDQSDELSGLRTRLVSYLAFVGSATAFLLGSGLNATKGAPDPLFFTLAALGTILAGVAILLTVLILKPGSAKFAVTSDAELIIGQYIEREVPFVNEGELLRDLALHNNSDVSENRAILRRLRWWYTSAIGIGSGQLLLFTILVWTHAHT